MNVSVSIEIEDLLLDRNMGAKVVWNSEVEGIISVLVYTRAKRKVICVNILRNVLIKINLINKKEGQGIKLEKEITNRRTNGNKRKIKDRTTKRNIIIRKVEIREVNNEKREEVRIEEEILIKEVSFGRNPAILFNGSFQKDGIWIFTSRGAVKNSTVINLSVSLISREVTINLVHWIEKVIINLKDIVKHSGNFLIEMNITKVNFKKVRIEHSSVVLGTYI